MAPEVMRGLNHTGSVDYFAVGIITYELMMGKRPYTGKNRKEIKEQMMQKQVYLDCDDIPLGWSPESADFINKLLIRKDTNRLGYYNYYEIKRHPWLNDINFDNLLSGKIRAPFIPRKNNENYDKKYCQEIEEIGIETNLRYESYKNNEKYSHIFEGFTFYNIDESQLLSCNDIYKKPSVKYIKNNPNININYDSIINKSKTINIDCDYKRRNQKISHNRVQSANNTSMRTIHYSNGNEITTDRILNYNLRREQDNVIIKDTKYSFKNSEDIYVMASPNRRGRITINNDETNIDNTFRKYANHSFVETNYSKGKTIRRSYSSSNLYNNNYVNVFNLLVNNINNINNNNILLNNFDNIKNKKNFPRIPKNKNPINYNTTNKSKIPIDKKNNITNYKNNNNYIVSSYNNRTLIEKTKNSTFSYADNDKTLYEGIKKNDYNNNCFRYSSNYSYKNNNINNILNIESIESERKNYIIPDKYKNLKRNHSYSYICYFKNDNPQNSIKKIVPIKLDNKNNSFKNNNIQINSYFNKENKEYISKIKTIEYSNKNKTSNSFIYIDKYNKNKEIISPIDENYKLDNSKSQKSNKTNGAKNMKFDIIEGKYLDKRAPPPIILLNNYKDILIKNEIKNDISKKNNNHVINTPRNEKISEKNSTYKKIPIPFPLNEKKKKKSLVLDNELNKNLNININIERKNKNLQLPKYDYFNPYYTINNKENIKNNLGDKFLETIDLNNQLLPNDSNNKIEIKSFRKINRISSIIPKKIIEKNFQRYQYLNNFEKYQKIKNHNNKNKNFNNNKKIFNPSKNHN